jgi:hypothetical protein
MTARDPNAVVVQFGLSEHPDVRKWNDQRFDVKKKLQSLSQILYRCDMDTLFGDLTGPKLLHTRAMMREARQAARIIGPGPAAGPLTLDSVMEHNAVEHLRAVLPEGALCSISAIPAGEPVPHLLSLDESFGLNRGWAAGPEEHHDGRVAGAAVPMEQDIDDGDGVAGEQRGQAAALATDWQAAAVFFKMVHPRPNKMKLARMPVASGGRLRAADIAVTIHAAKHHAEQPCVMNDPVLLDGCAVMTMAGLKESGLETLLERLHTWEVQAGTCYAFKCLPTEEMQDRRSATLARLVSADAFPDTGKYLEVSMDNEDMAAAVSIWARAGLVTSSEAEGERGSVHVAFSAKGVLELTLALRCHRPRAVCEVREGEIALGDRTAFELASMLIDDGWEWRPLPKKRQERLALAYTPGGDQSWYSFSPSLEHRYLQALLQAPDLFDKGVVEIPHWSPTPAETYGAILLGRNPRCQRLVLGGDIDAGDVHVRRRAPSVAGAAGAAAGGGDADIEDQERPPSLTLPVLFITLGKAK